MSSNTRSCWQHPNEDSKAIQFEKWSVNQDYNYQENLYLVKQSRSSTLFGIDKYEVEEASCLPATTGSSHAFGFNSPPIGLSEFHSQKCVRKKMEKSLRGPLPTYSKRIQFLLSVKATEYISNYKLAANWETLFGQKGQKETLCNGLWVV